MRSRILKINGWLHKTILLASVIPAVYAMPIKDGEISFWALFFKSLLIFVPVVVTDFGIRRCKGLFSYLLVCMAVFCGTGITAYGLGSYRMEDQLFWGYVVVLLMETAGLCVGQFSDRMRQQEEFLSCLPGDREEVTFAVFFRQNQNFWDRPHLFLLCWFWVVYGMGIFFVNPSLCNQAVACTAVYVILLAVSVYLDKTERYLSLHRHVAGVPKSRIYGIGRGMMLVFVSLLIVGMLPGILLLKQRKYLDIRSWLARRQNSELVLELEAEQNEEGDGGWDMQLMEELAGPIKEAPEWVEWMYDLLAAVCVGVLSILAWHGIRAVFAEFRASHDENGDLVEEILTEEDDVMESLKLRRIRRRRDGTGVRRTYRRMIQTYRKDKPEPWESPAEIEEKAGLAEDTGMQELHLKYENVRYGNGAGESWSEKNKAFIKKI